MKIAVILGYGVFQESNLEYKSYLDWIISISQKQKIEKIITCGNCTNKALPGLSEAKTIAGYLDKIWHNHPPTYLEDRSITTPQNIQFASKFLDPSDEISVFGDRYRGAKIIWLSLHYLLKLDKVQIGLLLFDYRQKLQLGESFIFQNLTFFGFDFPSRTSELILYQTYSSLVEVESAYEEAIEQKLIQWRRSEFGLPDEVK